MEEEDKDVAQAPKYWLPDRLYQVLKWIGLAALPTLAWGYQAIAGVWNLPLASEASMTLNIIGTLVAVLIGASALKGAANEAE